MQQNESTWNLKISFLDMEWIFISWKEMKWKVKKQNEI